VNASAVMRPIFVDEISGHLPIPHADDLIGNALIDILISARDPDWDFSETECA